MKTPNDQTPRGILPTYVTEDELVLCKRSPSIRNTYEIRLSLFLAVKDHRRFVLNVPEDAWLDPSLRTLITNNGGVIESRGSESYSVSISHFGLEFEETDGWVLGDQDALATLKASIQDPWLQAKLTPGTTFGEDDLARLHDTLQAETITLDNIDGENIGRALAALLRRCDTDDGCIVIQ